MKTKKVVFTEPAFSDRELLLFLHFRLTGLFAELETIKEILALNQKISPAQLGKLAESKMDFASWAYEREAKKFYEGLQSLKQKTSN